MTHAAQHEAPPRITAARYVTVELASVIIGLSAAAIRQRISRGVWLENKEWRKSPDGRVWIDTEGVRRWVERG